MNARVRTAGRGVAAVSLITGMMSAAMAVDTSCVGVQLVSAEQRFNSLPSADREALAPVMDKIRVMARQVELQAAAAEAAYNAALEAAKQAYSAAHPGQTQEQPYVLLQGQRSGNQFDSALADHLEAQALIHGVEVEMATLAARMPSHGDRRDLSMMTRNFSSGQGAGNRFVAAAMREDSAYGQLLSTLAVAQAATRGSNIPAGALVGRRFDTTVGDPTVEAALAATDVMVALDGDRLGTNLLRGHIEDGLRGDVHVRRETMRAQTKTSATVAGQVGTDLIRTNSREFAAKQMGRVARQAIAPPAPGEQPQAKAKRTAAQVMKAVEKVRRIRIIVPSLSASAQAEGS